MLSQKQTEKLKANWGELTETMECNAEVRVYDPLSDYECYIFGINQENEDEILCIINISGAEVAQWSLKELEACYNSHGEGLQVDFEYRPRQAKEIYRRLIRGSYYEYNRY